MSLDVRPLTVGLLLCACPAGSQPPADRGDDRPALDLAAPLDAAEAGVADAPVDHATELLVQDGPGADQAAACPAGKWCSALYPPAWHPGWPADGQGRFLHDFSHAGYHGGAIPLPAQPPGQTFDAVTGYGADSTGVSDATASIQAAIAAAAAAKGGVVWLPAGTYRCDGALQITADHVVLRGAGKDQTTLHFSSHAGMGGKSHITLQGAVSRGPDVPLAKDGVERAAEVHVDDPGGLKPGDEVAVGWVITPDFVAEHKMTGTWTVFLGQWKPFFRRTVTAVDSSQKPARVSLDVPLRYPARLRDQASLRPETGYLREAGVEHLSLSNAVKWDDAWSEDQVHVVGLVDCADCWVKDVHTAKSPYATGWSAADITEYHLQSSGLLVVGSKRVTVADSSMHNAQNRGSGGNGYLFEISRSNEVLIRDCVATGGRHNLIQNWDFGATGCVFLRCQSKGSQYATLILGVPVLTPAMCEYHHSLATANLVDSCQIDDGWLAVNRLNESSGAGHTSTACVFWNTTGAGVLRSLQYGWGYIIGTGPGVTVDTALGGFFAAGTQPADFVEGPSQGAGLWPSSLYEDQLARRLGP